MPWHCNDKNQLQVHHLDLVQYICRSGFALSALLVMRPTCHRTTGIHKTPMPQALKNQCFRLPSCNHPLLPSACRQLVFHHQMQVAARCKEYIRCNNRTAHAMSFVVNESTFHLVHRLWSARKSAKTSAKTK